MNYIKLLHAKLDVRLFTKIQNLLSFWGFHPMPFWGLCSSLPPRAPAEDFCRLDANLHRSFQYPASTSDCWKWTVLLCRAKMEGDLKTFVSNKYNVLGEKIELRVTDIEQLTKDQSLTLKWFNWLHINWCLLKVIFTWINSVGYCRFIKLL